MGEPQQVVLELDEKDKENLQELQQSLSQAEKELQMVTAKLRQTEMEGKRAELTKAELDAVADETPAYVQVGKMFLLEPLKDIKASLADRVAGSTKDVDTLKEKQQHIKEVRWAARAGRSGPARPP
jgi:chaperonin cofactor prefoldin